MALFRDGVKIGNKDIRVGLSKKRGQGILRKLGILEDDGGRKKFEKDGMGEVQTIRTLVGKSEGFQFPVNFKVTFGPPTGIQQPVLDQAARQEKSQMGTHDVEAKYGGPNKGQVKGGSLDWRTHIMNNSTTDLFLKRYEQAKTSASTIYKFANFGAAKREESLLDLYCSKVTIPEKTITTGLYRHYGDPFPFPQNVMYGAITTTFYCDGTMYIKNYFDAWQKLIYNDMTGNFNYYDEYTAEFDVHTRTTIAQPQGQPSRNPHGEPEKSRAEKISQGIKDFTKGLNDATGVEGPRGEDIGKGSKQLPIITFRENYGVRVFECFPQTVGGIDLAHDATDSIATFDVTWSYRKWNPFKMGNIGNRSTINLSVGEFRNEKDGFPFLEDLPEELSGPLTGAVNQGIVTGPLSNASNFLG